VKPIAQARVAVAGRWPFPLPPWPSAVTGRAFVVFPGLAPPTDRSRFAEALVSSTSPSKRSKDGGNRLAPTPPLLGFAKCALSPTCLPRVHSREPKPPSARWVPAIGSSSVHVVPPHLDGFLRAEVAGLLHPAAGPGFVAFHAHRGLLPEAVRRRSGARDPQWRSPRRGSHPSKSSLRRQPHRITAAVASLPLPSRRSGPTIRLGDAPIRRSGPPRHRARGAFTPPKRRGTAAHDPRRSKSHRSATWTGRSDQGRGGSTPSAPPRPESERPKTPSLVLQRPKPRSVAGGCIASTEAGGMRVRRIIAERFGFEALLRRRSSLSSGHRCRRPTFVPSMGFVPLRGSSCSRCVPAVPGRRPPKPKPRRADPRHPTRKRVESGGSAGSLCGFTRGVGPEPVVATTQGGPKPGHGPAPFKRRGRGPCVATPR
jgi:hypothetical protein